MNTSRDMKATVYGKFAVVFNPADVAEGRLRDAFSIHEEIDGNPNWRTTVYERTITQADEHPTEEAARESAQRLARAWIDSQPS